MLTQTKKHLENKKITKGNFKSRVLLACKKATAASCIVGIVMITNTSFASAYEAHTVNVTARIVNNIPGINPPGGEFCTAGEFKVELNVSLASADIYYTIDGTDPVCGVNKYGAPFELPNNAITTVKAVACHNIMRNEGQVLIQSAIMKKVFNVSEPIVNVIKPENGDVWYCSPSNPIIYPVEWTVENYRGTASELDIDIIYIIDDGKNENGGVTGEIDDKDTRFHNLPGTAGLTGENTSYQFELTQEYCYYGYGWMKVIATEPNNCGGFGISGRIFDPMAPDGSCNVSTSNNDAVPAVSLDPANINIEPEPAIDEENDEDETIDDIDVVDVDVVDNATNEDAESENGEESVNENTDAVDINNENDDETDENIKNEDADDNTDDLDNEEDNINNDENDTLEDDGIIIDREEDFDEENNTDDNDVDEDVVDDDDDGDEDEDEDEDADENVNDGDEDIDDDSIADSDISPDDDISDDIDDESIGDNNDDDGNSGDSDDNDSLDDAPTIEEDDGSTVIEFSF